MSEHQQELDLRLWMDQSLIRRQNQLKNQFIQLLEAVGNSVSNQELNLFFEQSKGKKISKGNDLLGFPYQVLDLVRVFDYQSGLNIRLLNWFGNGFFVLIFLGEKVGLNFETLYKSGFSLGMVEDPWDFGALIIENQVISSLENHSLNQKGFKIWIKKINLESNPEVNRQLVQNEVKKILKMDLNLSD